MSFWSSMQKNQVGGFSFTYLCRILSSMFLFLSSKPVCFGFYSPWEKAREGCNWRTNTAVWHFRFWRGRVMLDSGTTWSLQWFPLITDIFCIASIMTSQIDFPVIMYIVAPLLSRDISLVVQMQLGIFSTLHSQGWNNYWQTVLFVYVTVQM